MFKALKGLALASYYRFQDPYYQGFAASLAFYIILSVVPMLLLLSQFLGFFGLSLESLKTVLNQYLTTEMSELINGLLSFTTSSASNIIFSLVVLWSASKAQFSLVRMGSHTMSEKGEKEDSFIKDRLWALVSILLVLVTLAIGLVILVYGEVILTLAMKIIEQFLMIPVQDIPGKIWLILRWPISFFVYFLVIWVNYSLISFKKLSFKKVAPGAIFASVGILLVTFVYALYTNLIANYDILYGALASIVALMMWVYLISWCLGGGLIINRVYRDKN